MTKGEVEALRAWLKRSLDIETHGNIDVLCDAADEADRLRELRDVAAELVGFGIMNMTDPAGSGAALVCPVSLAALVAAVDALAEQPNVRKES